MTFTKSRFISRKPATEVVKVDGDNVESYVTFEENGKEYKIAPYKTNLASMGHKTTKDLIAALKLNGYTKEAN